MLRSVICVVLALFIFVGGLIAAEGTIVKYEKGKLTVKVGDKEQEIALKGVKVTNKDGGEVPGKERRDAFKKDGKVEIVEKDGKVTEVKIK